MTYLNEGHVPFHKRDGFAFQLWGREQLIGRWLSLAAGVGPYLYYDTHVTASPSGKSYADEHGVGAIASVAATFYTGGRLFFQARGNWIATGRTTEIVTATVGIGVRLLPRWALRGTFHRVTTSDSRDSDVFLIGLSYLF